MRASMRGGRGGRVCVVCGGGVPVAYQGQQPADRAHVCVGG